MGRMRDIEYSALAEVIQRALDKTALSSTEFSQEHGCPLTHNARIHYRQSVIVALLRGHRLLGVVEDRYVEWGRVKVVDPEGGSPFLLKPRAALLEPDTDRGVQQHLPGISAGDALLAYELSGESVTLYVGKYRQVRQRNGKVDYQIVGELRAVWTDRDTEPVVFDQEEGNDWTAHLDDHEGEAGTLS